MLAAGKLRCPITISAQSVIQDTSGQPLPSVWTPVLKTMAAITAASSRDVYATGAGYDSQVTHKIAIRYPAVPITAGMRVNYRNRTFDVIAAFDPDERRREYTLMVLEQTK